MRVCARARNLVVDRRLARVMGQPYAVLLTGKRVALETVNVGQSTYCYTVDTVADTRY